MAPRVTIARSMLRGRVAGGDPPGHAERQRGASEEHEGRRAQVGDPAGHELVDRQRGRPTVYMNGLSVIRRPGLSAADAWSIVISTITSPRSQSISCRRTGQGTGSNLTFWKVRPM
jgi:hypothetical protein